MDRNVSPAAGHAPSYPVHPLAPGRASVPAGTLGSGALALVTRLARATMLPRRRGALGRPVPAQLAFAGTGVARRGSPASGLASGSAEPLTSAEAGRRRRGSQGRGLGPPLLALAIVIGAFGLRMAGLARPSFWWDEAYSAVVARGSLGEIVAEIATRDYHPPLHYFLFHVWRLLAGESELALRFTAVWAGTATVALAFATGRRLYGPAGGGVAALLVALSPMLVYYSTEARMFALAALFALLVLYLGLRLADLARGWLWLGLAVALGLYNFYYAAFAPVALGAIGLIARSRRDLARRYGAAIALAGLLFLPWLPIMVGRTVDWTSPWTAPTTPGRILAWTWPAFMTGLPAVEVWRERPYGIVLGAVALLGAIGLLAALTPLASAAQRRAIWYAAASGLLPLGAMALVATVRPVFHPRYAIPAVPGIYLALAGLLVLPSRWLLPLRVTLALGIATTFGLGLTRYELQGDLARDDYRSIVGYLTEREQPGDIALTNAPPGFQYYYRGAMPHQEFPTGAAEPSRIVAELNALARGYRRLWYLTHDLRPSDPEQIVDGQLLGHARLIDERRMGFLRLRLFELPDPPAFALPAGHPLPGFDVGPALRLESIGVDERPDPTGVVVPVTLTWLVKSPPPDDYGIWAQLRDDDGDVVGRGDRQARDREAQLSRQWIPGTRVTTHHLVPIAVGTLPGSYVLELGVYRLGDLGGLEWRDAAGAPIGQSFVWRPVVLARDPAAVATDPTLTGGRGRIGRSLILAGSALGARTARAGNAVAVTALWQVLGPVGPRVMVVRLLDADGQVRVEQREVPGRGRYPAERWIAGDVVRDQPTLRLPATLPGGDYRVWVGMAAPGAAPVGVQVGQLTVEAIPRRRDVPPLEHPLTVDFGDGVRLIGWSTRREASGALRLTLVWQPTATPSREYRVFNHVLGDGDRIVAQRDGVPVDWTRPTTGWIAGEVIEDSYRIELPADAANPRLRIGVYDPTTGQRLRATGGDDHVDLGTVAGGQ